MTGMPNSRDPLPEFHSLRIVSEKAQQWLRRARGKWKKERTKERRPPAPPVMEERRSVHVVEVSLPTVVRATVLVLLVLVGAWILFHLRDKILVLLLSLFVAAIIDPGVRSLERWHLPRGVAVLIVYLTFLVLFLFLLLSLIPILAEQIQQIAVTIGFGINTFLSQPSVDIPFASPRVNQQLTVLAQNVLHHLSAEGAVGALQRFGENLSVAAQGSLRFAASVAGSVVNFIFTLILVLVMAFFVQMEKEKLGGWVRVLFPQRYRSYLDTKADAIAEKLARWIRGQLMLCLVIGFLVFLALSILQMPYALTLAVLAGFTEFIPYAGPLIAAIPAVLIAFTQGGLVPALFVALVYYAIQWCENNLLVPLIMRQAVGLSPVVILFAMLVGISFPDTIPPVLGIILAVPTTTIIALFLEDYRERRRS